MKYPMNKYRIFEFTDKKTGRLTIKAESTYAGKRVRGVATCHPNDAYVPETGTKLAVLRCAEKITEKRVKRAQKCVDVAEREMVEAQRKYFKMTTYLNDAKTEYGEAVEELNEFMEEMGKN